MVKKEVQQAWDKFASVYDEFVIKIDLITSSYAKCADVLSQRYGTDAIITILDVASSSGEPSLTIARSFPQAKIISTDVVVANKALGERRAAAAGISNVTFETADAENLSGYTDGQFDAVVCAFGLMFVDVPAALSEFRRVLKPGGTLVFAIWAPLKQAAFFLFEQQLVRDVDPAAPAPEEVAPTRLGPLNKELVSMAQAAGFCGVECRQEVAVFRYEKPQILLDAINGGLNMPAIKRKLAEQGKTDVDQFVEERFNALLSQSTYLKEEGAVEMPTAYYFYTAEAPPA